MAKALDQTVASSRPTSMPSSPQAESPRRRLPKPPQLHPRRKRRSPQQQPLHPLRSRQAVLLRTHSRTLPSPTWGRSSPQDYWRPRALSPTFTSRSLCRWMRPWSNFWSFFQGFLLTFAVVFRLREQLNKESKVKISVNDILIKAAGIACTIVPEVNSQWMGDKIRQ